MNSLACYALTILSLLEVMFVFRNKTLKLKMSIISNTDKAILHRVDTLKDNERTLEMFCHLS